MAEHAERGQRSAARGSPSRDLREGGAWTRGQRLKNDLIYALIRATVFIACRLPRSVVRGVCRALGLLGFLALGRLRAVARARLEVGLGKPPGRLVARAFVTAAGFAADTLELLRPDERAGSKLVIDEASRRVFADALSEGRGVVFVAAHLGPWERMAALLAEQGFPVTTVARESYDPRLTELYERVRRPRGVRSLYRGRPGVVMSIARELAEGRAVGLLVDLPTRVPSITCRLFGDDALVPIGPARLALARRAAVVVGTCAPPGAELDRGDRHLPSVRITRISTEDLARNEEAERILVSRITEEVSRRIAAWPEAWFGVFAPPRLRRA